MDLSERIRRRREIRAEEVAARTTAERLQAGLRRLAIATCIMFLAGVGVSVYFYLGARENRRALCTFVGDLELRVNRTEAFLDKHPQGFGGITAPELRLSVSNMRRTIRSMNNLNC